jgi:hypothetical protein
MEQPKKKLVTREVAEKKRDSLDHEAQLKKQAGLSSNDFERSQELMRRAGKDYDTARKWDENIKKSEKKK